MRASCSITDLQSVRQRPLVIDGAAGRDDGSESILKSFAVHRRDANLHIRNKAKEAAAPVGAAPGVSAVEAFVTGLWLTFRHAVEHVAPDLLCGQLSSLHTRNGLNVGGETFFHPVLIIGQAREPRMDELVGDGPVVREFPGRDVLAEADAREGRPAADIAPGGAVYAIAAGHGNDEDANARHRKMAVVGHDGPRRRLDTLCDDVVAEIESARGEIHLQDGTPHRDAARGAWRTVASRRVPLRLRSQNRFRCGERSQHPESGPSAEMGSHAMCKTAEMAIR